MISLFPDQSECVQRIRVAYRKGARAPLFVAPCGFGKTVLFSFMTHSHIDKGGRVLILVHREELIAQVCATLERFEIPFGVVSAKHPRPNRYAKVFVASVFTLVRRLDSIEAPTLIIIDEAHHCVNSTTWGKTISTFPAARRLGVTATPIRLSGEGLSESFDSMILGPTTKNLIDAGRLSKFQAYCPKIPDVSRVKRRAGEFNSKDLNAIIDRPSVTGDVVEHYAKATPDKKAVVFCVSVEHAQHVAAQFRDRGFAAQAIDGEMPEEWRREAVKDFRLGTLPILTSCQLVDEGFDVPDIEVAIDLAPTMSLARHLQRNGRALRVAPGKECAILSDHAGNILRHGLPTEDRQWTLAGTKSGDTQGAGRILSMRICKQCFAANKSGTPRCVVCGNWFPVEARTVPSRKGELEPMTEEEIAVARANRAIDDAKKLQALEALGRQRGYKDPRAWAQHVLRGQEMKKERKAKVSNG